MTVQFNATEPLNMTVWFNAAKPLNMTGGNATKPLNMTGRRKKFRAIIFQHLTDKLRYSIINKTMSNYARSGI